MKLLSKIDPRVVLFVIVIIMLALAAGAPSMPGGVGM
jgi:hypothetical protein